jgi:uncharacterized protein (TIGR00255 family)
MDGQQSLRSMTGVGVAAGSLSPRLDAAVRLTSVNGRFLEVSLRSQPRLELSDLEPAVRSALTGRLNRGRVTVLVELRPTGGATELRFRWEVAEALALELERTPPSLNLAPVSLRDLMALPGFAEGGGGLDLTSEEREALLVLVAEAAAELDRSRQIEAQALTPVLADLTAELRSFCRWLDGVHLEAGRRLRQRLRERLEEALAGMAVPEERVLLEAAIAADRADVGEELQRLNAHMDHLERLLSGPGPVGKKLDFLLQEIQREVNTAGAKCRELESGEWVVAAKTALERLREQSANLE